MNVAALVLTVVFIADDAALPMLAVELVERPGARQLIVGAAGPDGVVSSSMTTDAGGRRVLPAGAFPMAPAGASVSPAVDGVILTLDDAGPLSAVLATPPPPPTPAKKPAATTKARSVHPWPPPSLPVLGPRGLRLFLPAVVDGAPMSASLHLAGGASVPGFAVAFTRRVDDADLGGVVAIARGGDDVEVGAPRLLGPGPVCGEDPGGTLLLRQTTATATAARCEGGLEIRAFGGTRAADVPAKDSPARGLLLRRAPPPTSPPPSPSPPPPASAPR